MLSLLFLYLIAELSMYIRQIISFQVIFTSKVVPSFSLNDFSSEDCISQILVVTSRCFESILASFFFLFMCLHPYLFYNFMALSSHSCFIHFSSPSLVNLGQQASFRRAQGIASTFRTHCSTPVSEITVFASFEGLKHKFRSRMHYCQWWFTVPCIDVFVRKCHGLYTK